MEFKPTHIMLNEPATMTFTEGTKLMKIGENAYQTEHGLKKIIAPEYVKEI